MLRGSVWNPLRTNVEHIASRTSGIRHVVDWRENVFTGHAGLEPYVSSRRSRAREDDFPEGALQRLRERRADAKQPDSDLCSENSEDAITWSVFTALLAMAPEVLRTHFAVPGPASATFWPRQESGPSEARRRYQALGLQLEPFHEAPSRSEVDLILDSGGRDALVEAKWSADIRDGGKSVISKVPETDQMIVATLGDLAESSRIIKTGVSVKGALAAGLYQTLRHLIYRDALRAQGRDADLYYLLCGQATGIAVGNQAAKDSYAERMFAATFEAPFPRIVLWEELLADVPDAVLDRALPDGEFHAGATLRHYLDGRTVSGRRWLWR